MVHRARASAIGIINPSTHAITSVATTADASPSAIAAGPDGNVWFTEKNLEYTSGGGTSFGGAIGVANLDTHLVVTAQPESPVTANSGFGLTNNRI